MKGVFSKKDWSLFGPLIQWTGHAEPYDLKAVEKGIYEAIKAAKEPLPRKKGRRKA